MNVALKMATRQVYFPSLFPFQTFPVMKAPSGVLPHLHWSDSLEGCWRCCSLYWERILQVGCPACGWNQKLFQTTKTHPVLLGLTNLHLSSLEAAHVYRVGFFKIFSISPLNWSKCLRSQDEVLPSGKVLLSCHSGFLWTPGCWSTVGPSLESEHMRHACCC